MLKLFLLMIFLKNIFCFEKNYILFNTIILYYNYYQLISFSNSNCFIKYNSTNHQNYQNTLQFSDTSDYDVKYKSFF